MHGEPRVDHPLAVEAERARPLARLPELSIGGDAEMGAAEATHSTDNECRCSISGRR